MLKKNHSNEHSYSENREIDLNKELLNLHKKNLDDYGDNWNYHSLVTLKRQTISRILYWDYLYRKIINVPGVICEFGVQWGTTLSTLISLRGIYEPYNYTREIFGFDTFEGFKNIDTSIDGKESELGDYKVSKNYEDQLNQILTIQDKFSPLPHIKKFSLINGDASETVIEWKKNNPNLIISMLILDMDLYSPTKIVLEELKQMLSKGSVVVLDNFTCKSFKGEAKAVNEVFGFKNLELKRDKNMPSCAWFKY